MGEFIEGQRPLIERTGLGLLPGISLALALCIGLIAAIMLEEWWVILTVVVGIIIVTAVVMAIISGLLGREDDIYSHDA